MKVVVVIGLLGLLVAPGSAGAATTCRNSTLTATGSTVVTVYYRSTGVTFRDLHQETESPCGTVADPWTIHYRGGPPTGGDLVTVAVYDAAPRIDLAPAGPGTLLHVDAFDPTGVEIHITGDTLSIANRAGEHAGTITASNEVWVVEGSPGDDLIYGGDESENLGGGSGGDDTIDGGGGDDSIGGGTGADTLDGGPGEDVIFGGGGRDSITGGPGPDHLHGDNGKDFIDAADGEVDEVRGGNNWDVARLDPDDDVRNIQKVEP